MLPPYKRKPRLRTYKKGSQTEFGNYCVKTLDSRFRGNDREERSKVRDDLIQRHQQISSTSFLVL